MLVKIYQNLQDFKENIDYVTIVDVESVTPRLSEVLEVKAKDGSSVYISNKYIIETIMEEENNG